MQVLPVIDLLGGQVVRGVGGRRHEYRPIVSRISPSPEPLAVARAFRDHFGLSELYLADLDAIAGRSPAVEVFSSLLQDGFQLWVDAGLTEVDRLANLGVQTIVAGLESLTGPTQLRELLTRWSPQRIVFSLDLKEGRPLGTGWDAADPWPIALQAIQLGVRRLLVLDLAAVGENQGLRTADLCGPLRKHDPGLELTTGGGVRGPADLLRLKELGVNKVLVASALHDGRLTRDDVGQAF